MVNAGGIDAFLNTLDSKLIESIDQSLWGLGNIAGDNKIYVGQIEQKGGASKIFNLLKQAPNNPSIQRNCSW